MSLPVHVNGLTFSTNRAACTALMFRPLPCPSCQRCGGRSQGAAVLARAEQPTRVTKTLTEIPRQLDIYFKDNFLRRFLWTSISLFSGYYSGNMVSLAFGSLAVNDVVAAVTTAAFCEVVSRAFYRSWPRPPLYLVFANFFKMGVTFAFMADAYKLAG